MPEAIDSETMVGIPQCEIFYDLSDLEATRVAAELCDLYRKVTVMEACVCTMVLCDAATAGISVRFRSRLTTGDYVEQFVTFSATDDWLRKDEEWKQEWAAGLLSRFWMAVGEAVIGGRGQ